MSNREIWVWDKAQGKVVLREDKWEEAPKSHFVIEDTMPLTKSPIDGKMYFTSKSELRKHYRQHGMIEVGNEYENGGYDRVEAERARDEDRALSQRIKQNLIDRAFHGKQ